MRKPSELLELLLSNYKADDYNGLCACVGHMFWVKKCITSYEMGYLYQIIDDWIINMKYTFINYILFEVPGYKTSYLFSPNRKRPRIALLKKYMKSSNDRLGAFTLFSSIKTAS